MILEKSSLRSMMRKLKVKHQSRFEEWGHRLCRLITEHPRWKSASTVLMYHALPDEPNLQYLLDSALEQGLQVLLPVVVGDDLLLKYYKGKSSLHDGAFHILEPTGETFPLSRYSEIDLAVVPGMAFDQKGHRLGRGRGYYDRLLPRIPNAFLLGVCFPFQLLSEVPYEPHDVVMHEILSLPSEDY